MYWTLTFYITPDDNYRLVAAICGLQDYDNNHEEGETQYEFMWRMLVNYMTAQTQRWELKQAYGAISADPLDFDYDGIP